MSDNDNQNTNTNQPEQDEKPAKVKNNHPRKKRWRGSYHGEAFWASLVIMIIEGIFVHFFCFPMYISVAVSEFEGGEITAFDKMAEALGLFAFLFPIALVFINGCVMLSEDNNEHEKAMKIVNLIAYILYPVICLSGCALYLYSF